MNLPVKRHDSDRAHGASVRPGAAWWLDPWAELENVHRNVEQLLWAPGPWNSSVPRSLFPALDLEETDEGYIAEIDVPGVKKGDISVEVVGDEVRVHGEVKERERKGILRHRNRRVGTIDHVFTLPGGVDAERVTARLDDGVLTIHAPRSGSGRKSVKVPIS